MFGHESEVIAVFTFSIVKRIGEGNYLNDDSFIIERIRKERALNANPLTSNSKKPQNRLFRKDEKTRPS